MTINGVRLNFELYDTDNDEMNARYFEELNKMRTIKNDMPDGTEKEKNVYLCNRVKSIFDTVFGAGTGDKICGSRNNVLVCMKAYSQLISEQIRQNEEYENITAKLKSMNPAFKGE